uniref:Uncharacterized protein n=1 Tax=Eutreptiella gymnastica TaxID=73025 RepID=A0A7S1NGV0_9EUGL
MQKGHRVQNRLEYIPRYQHLQCHIDQTWSESARKHMAVANMGRYQGVMQKGALQCQDKQNKEIDISKDGVLREANNAFGILQQGWGHSDGKKFSMGWRGCAWHGRARQWRLPSKLLKVHNRPRAKELSYTQL